MIGEIIIDEIPHCHTKTLAKLEKKSYQPKATLICKNDKCNCENCEFKKRCVVIRPIYKEEEIEI